MPRGNAGQTKVHYQGTEEDFVIFVDDIEQVQKWKNDRSIPLAQVVSGFKIFVTHKYATILLFTLLHKKKMKRRAMLTDSGDDGQARSAECA